MDLNITEINKEINKESNNKYKKVGSREDVYLGYAKNTSGGLRKDDIILKKKGNPESLMQCIKFLDKLN